MGLRINTNISSIQSIRRTNQNTAILNKSLAQMSSGQRITKAADDSAGLALSEKFQSAIKAYGSSKRNAMDGISMIQTAEGGLNEISNILIRLKELSVQAASDTIGNQERSFVQMEYSHLSKEIDRIASSTDFNGIPLLQGKTNDSIEGNVTFQIGILNRPLIDRIEIKPEEFDARTQALDINGTGVLTKTAAQESIDLVDKAITSVSSMRAQFGALQNRLTSTISNTSIITENLSAAKSRILDADIAEVSADLTKGMILQQAGISVLAQANSSPKVALDLLRNI